MPVTFLFRSQGLSSFILAVFGSIFSGCMGTNEDTTKKSCLAREYLLEFYQKSALTSNYIKVDTLTGSDFYVEVGAFQNPKPSASGSEKGVMCQDYLESPSLTVDEPIQVIARGTIPAYTNLFLDTALVKKERPSTSSLEFPADYRFGVGIKTFVYSATLFGTTIRDTVRIPFTDGPTL